MDDQHHPVLVTKNNFGWLTLFSARGSEMIFNLFHSPALTTFRRLLWRFTQIYSFSSSPFGFADYATLQFDRQQTEVDVCCKRK